MASSYSHGEYAATITFNRTNALAALKAQKKFIKYWRGEVTKAEFSASVVEAGATIAERLFRAPITKIVTFVAQALANANTYESAEVLRIAQKGKTQLEALWDIFEKNPNYSSITFKVRYLTFTSLATGKVDFTIIQGNIVPTKILTTGGGSVPL